MNDYKSFLTSKTMWGILVMVLAKFVPVFTGMDESGQAGLVDDIILAAGAVLAVIGRFTAKKQVTVTGEPK